MKREIKFRGLYKGDFVHGNLIQGTSRGQSFCHIEHSDFDDFGQWEVDPETVGQFTGLVDKNGVEIYEGDILCFPEYETKREPIRWAVEWDSERAAYTNWHPRERAEVIGNVYQHPELLGTAIGDRGGILSTQEKDTAESPGPQGIAQKKEQGHV